jgi:hypothetical protein
MSMPDRNDQPVVAEETDDFLDDDLDLDELPEAELADTGPGEPDMIDDDAADAIMAEDLELELSNGHGTLDLVEPEGVAPEAETELIEDEDLADDLVEPDFEPPATVAPVTMEAAAVPSDLEARIAKLEEAARALAAAEVTRDRKKVRRKVSAATTGAGAIGAVPILLQLAGAFNLDPELVATISTAAAAIGAFVAGWLTPERKPSIPTAVALDTLSQRS